MLVESFRNDVEHNIKINIFVFRDGSRKSCAGNVQVYNIEIVQKMRLWFFTLWLQGGLESYK